MIKAVEMNRVGVEEMSEKQLVEKANMAMLLMNDQEEKPVSANFIGANKERGTGGVVYEMNSNEAVEWITKTKMMKTFLAKMGFMVDYKAKMFEVVVDWIPTTFKVDQPEVWRAIEYTSRL